MRLLFRSLWLIGLVLLCVPLHLGWRLFRLPSPWPRLFLRWCTRAVGMRMTVTGTPVRGVALYAANHQSWMDILLIGGVTGASFVAKESVRKWPGAGTLAAMVGTIFIANSDRSAAGQQAARIREALMAGKSVAFFPEGRLDNGSLLPFRRALFGAVVPPIGDELVQPIAIDYGEDSEELIWPSRSSAVKNAIDIMKRPGLDDVAVHFLAPIRPQPDGHRKELAQACEDAIAEKLGQQVQAEAEAA